MDRRVAIVTGGGRGLGKGISLALGTDGCAVVIVYHSQKTAAEQVAATLRGDDIPAMIYQADVSDRAQVQTLISTVMTEFGRVDVLVNNAGVTSRSTTADLSEAEWNRIMDVNLKGAFLCSQAVIQHMITRGWGRIIHITSIAGQTGGGIGPHYAASKAGMIGLMRFMARELGPHGITVNAVAPSGIPTDMLAAVGLQPNPNRPVGRAGTPEDVAAAVRFLTSDDSGYMTGQVLSVNGGSFIG